MDKKLSDALSQTANKGRYGDSILVHMNPNELKTLAKASGLEDPTINPDTGLPEAFWLEAGMLALGAYNAYQSGRKSEVAAGSMYDEYNDMVTNLGTLSTNLTELYAGKSDILTAELSQAFEKIGSKFSGMKERWANKIDQTVKSTDLYQSEATRRDKIVSDEMSDQYTRGREGIISEGAKSRAELKGWYEQEKSNINLKLEQAKNKRNLAKKQEDSWYLGKYLGKGIQGIIPGGETGGWGW